MFDLGGPCTYCKNKASYYILDVMTSSNKQEYYLCDMCMAKYDKEGFLKMFAVPLMAVDDLTASIFNEAKAKLLKPIDITCPKCGMTFSLFNKTKRVGCANDYELFGLGPVIKEYHKADKHVGKIPSTHMTSADLENQIKKFKADMAAAVKAEQYEEAARLRDQLKRLEK